MITSKAFINAISAAVILSSALPAWGRVPHPGLSGSILGSDTAQAARCFDNSFDTAFTGTDPYNWWGDPSYVRNWVGLDLGQKYVITSVGLGEGNNSDYEGATEFAVVQGANKADFSDAIPIAMFKEAAPQGEMAYLDVNVSRGFRYVRVMATNSVGNFGEIEIYGAPGEGDDSRFFQVTNLPTVAFNTPGMRQIVSKDDKHKESYVAVVWNDGTSILEDANAQMKGRGNGSWTFPKKPFQIKFDKKQRPLDAPAKAKKWTLINNYGDRSLMRNKLAFDISREAGMVYTPFCAFVDVIYNGEYAGAYQLCDQVEVNPDRVELTEMTPDDIAGEALTGGYFVEIDAYADQESSWFRSARGIPVTIKSPDEDEIVAQQSSYIKSYFNTMEAALFADNFTDPEEGYRKYLDLESFLRYFIVCELDGNIDSFWSTYMWKERGDEQFHVGPVWDVDLGFQNYGSPNPVDALTDFLYTHRDASKANGMREFVDRIVKSDAGAVQLLSDMWSELRQNGNINYEFLEERIDAYAAELDESQQLNFRRWPILDKSVQKGQQVFGSYEGEIDNIKTYLAARLPKLDILMKRHTLAVPELEIDSADTDAETAYYDLQGRLVDFEVAGLQPGIYVRRTGSVVEKVAVGR